VPRDEPAAPARHRAAAVPRDDPAAPPSTHSVPDADAAEAAPDPAAGRERALGLAYRHLGRRDRSVAEVRRHLLGKGLGEDVVEDALAELREQGYLDDARFATRLAEDRRALDGWGSERIARALADAGVDRDVAAAAVAAGAGDELEAAVALLRRRFREPPADDRERDRALGLLVRRGYELELAYDAVRALGRDSN
jgi:regulatory protein